MAIRSFTFAAQFEATALVVRGTGGGSDKARMDVGPLLLVGWGLALLPRSLQSRLGLRVCVGRRRRLGVGSPGRRGFRRGGDHYIEGARVARRCAPGLGMWGRLPPIWRPAGPC